MTVVVAFLCTDGVVIAADSMLTPNVGSINVGHHKGQKIEVIRGPQIFAYAGDLGQAARVKIWADANHEKINQANHAIDWPLSITQNMINQFNSTGVGQSVNVNSVMAFTQGGDHQCCVFEGLLQPRLLDQHHYYVALGSGKLSADPFLRFLVDVFCGNGQPSVPEALFLAAWTIKHVIDTNPGGVAGPIRIATLEVDEHSNYQAKQLPDDEIAEHHQAIESAANALRQWRDGIQSGDAAIDAPEVPEPFGQG